LLFAGANHGLANTGSHHDNDVSASCQLVLMINEYIDMLVSFTVPTSHSAKVIRLIDT